MTTDQLRTAVDEAWAAMFASSIGDLRIGHDILPQPQMMGFFLHELIPIKIERAVKGWRRGAPPIEKDIHCVTDPKFSVEIKTSSHASGIFGNRSYAQPNTAGSRAKDGYYLAINFQPFSAAAKAAYLAQLSGTLPEAEIPMPRITLVRFGWLDHTDWRGQKSETGQAASLTGDALRYKLIPI